MNELMRFKLFFFLLKEKGLIRDEEIASSI
jgi:hypothetical protein